jgi:polyisoprenoid-binding protein YceI
MKKITLIVTILASLLAACTSQATPEPNPTFTVEEQPAPTEEIAPALEDTPAAVPEQVTGAVEYQIAAGESQVQYEVGETFINENNRFNVAIGVTTDINGTVTANVANPAQSSISTVSVDISKFDSGNSRRDGTIRRSYLESSRYPMATFVPTSIEGLPATYSEGQEISLKITGDLTVRETTKPVTFDVTLKIEGNTLSGTATTTILMSEYGFGPIQIAGILGTEDEVKVTFNFVARA